MSRTRNPRVLLWILIVALLAYVAYLYKAEGDKRFTSAGPPTVSQSIISDFRIEGYTGANRSGTRRAVLCDRIAVFEEFKGRSGMYSMFAWRMGTS